MRYTFESIVEKLEENNVKISQDELLILVGKTTALQYLNELNDYVAGVIKNYKLEESDLYSFVGHLRLGFSMFIKSLETSIEEILRKHTIKKID